MFWRFDRVMIGVFPAKDVTPVIDLLVTVSCAKLASQHVASGMFLCLGFRKLDLIRSQHVEHSVLDPLG